MRISLKDALSRKSLLFFCVWLALVLGCLGDSADEAQPDSAKKELKKSLLFPGLGQFGEKQYLKGIAFSGAEIFCIIQAVIHDRRGNDFYWKYRMSQTGSDAVEYRRMTERNDRTRNAFIVAGAGVWLLNMVDMFVFVKKKYRKMVSLSTSTGYEHASKTVRLGFQLHF